MKDSLTGLYNHAVLIELLEKELSKQKRNKGHISFIMLDIDYFKRINDTYGHMSGDMILKELSNILISSLRKGDIVGRYGGEEFGIVLVGTNKHDAFHLCERVIKITVSMGIFSNDYNSSITGNEIIQKADEQLYKVKKGGRNQVGYVE
jgi:diguanylate cyclase (GGDEF)-like protein